MEFEMRGQEVATLADLDAKVRAFMDATETRNAVLAVSRAGRLVHARGFRARKPGETTPAVEPWQVCRTASASKVITGIAIERLVQQGQLASDQPVGELVEPLLEKKLSEAGVVPNPKNPYVDRFHTVTVDELLRHLGGLADLTHCSQNANTAVLFQHPLPVTKYEIAAHSLTAPAGAAAYSNFGYSLLGMVVEAVTGKSYIDHVQDEILEPLGLWRARQARPLKSQILPDELDYSVIPSPTMPTTTESRVEPGETVEWPYGGENVANFDAFGGWVVGAFEFTRLFDALRAQQIPGLSLEYGSLRSWQGRYKTAAGTGVVDHGAVIMGAAGWIAMRDDETSIAVFYGTTRNDNVYPVPQYTVGFNDALDAVEDWPEHDLYPQLLARPKLPPVKLPDDFVRPGKLPLPLAERQRLARIAGLIKVPGGRPATGSGMRPVPVRPRPGGGGGR